MQTLRTTRALALTEILIAAAIFGISVIGMTVMITTATNTNSFNKRLTTATTLAQDKLEDILRLGYLTASTTAGTEAYGSIAGYTGYKRVTTITNNSPGTDSLWIQVDVFWDGDNRKTTMQAILGR